MAAQKDSLHPSAAIRLRLVLSCSITAGDRATTLCRTLRDPPSPIEDLEVPLTSIIGGPILSAVNSHSIHRSLRAHRPFGLHQLRLTTLAAEPHRIEGKASSPNSKGPRTSTHRSIAINQCTPTFIYSCTLYPAYLDLDLFQPQFILFQNFRYSHTIQI
jgi:hypothetical protein